ncbi:MAG: thioredoxin [Bacillota bacterium]
MGKVHVVTSQNFKEEVLESDLPVMVDFWAAWCGPCKMVSPVVEEIAKELSGSLKVCKLNVDENPMIAGEYGIMSIPTLLVFKNGKVAGHQIGFQPKAGLLRFAKNYI